MIKKGDLGAKCPSWKGGKVNKHGYVGVWNQERGEYDYEHRNVMESSLGRKLLSGEVVHHVNGDKTDNRLSNLKLLTKSSHVVEHYKEGFSPRQKLTIKQIRYIRCSEKSNSDLAKTLGVSYGAIYDIRNRASRWSLV